MGVDKERRNVPLSVSAPFYDRLRRYCARNNVAMSTVVEEVIDPALDLEVIPDVVQVEVERDLWEAVRVRARRAGLSVCEVANAAIGRALDAAGAP